MKDDLAAQGIAPDVRCNFYSGDGWHQDKVSVPREMALPIYINGQEIATILCTPTRLNQLVLGFLYMEGIINGISDIATMRICEEDKPVADIRLVNTEYTPPERCTLTSGCGGGVAFNAPLTKVVSDLVVTPEEVLSLMKQLYQRQDLFQYGGGMHASALCDRQQILIAVEDIGRHNTLDKIMGECLMRKLSTQECILLTTGRIPSDMLLKVSRMKAPIIASRGTPTDRAISLGRELDITIIGYARDRRLSVFSGEERVRTAE